jgi:hypothetical protein
VEQHSRLKVRLDVEAASKSKRPFFLDSNISLPIRRRSLFPWTTPSANKGGASRVIEELLLRLSMALDVQVASKRVHCPYGLRGEQ